MSKNKWPYSHMKKQFLSLQIHTALDFACSASMSLAPCCGSQHFVSLADSQAWKLLSRWQHKLFDFWLSLLPFFSAAPLLLAKVWFLWPAGFSDKTRIFFPWSKLCDYWYHFSINLRCFLMKVLKQLVRIYSFPSKRRGQILFRKPIIMYSFLSS